MLKSIFEEVKDFELGFRLGRISAYLLSDTSRLKKFIFIVEYILKILKDDLCIGKTTRDKF